MNPLYLSHYLYSLGTLASPSDSLLIEPRFTWPGEIDGRSAAVAARGNGARRVNFGRRVVHSARGVQNVGVALAHVTRSYRRHPA